MSDTISIEKLVELANSGAKLSELEQGLSVPLFQPEKQGSSEVYHSSSQVKDVVPTTPLANDIPAAERRASQTPTLPPTPQPSNQPELTINELSAKFDGVDIQDPVELLVMLDENILTGKTILHDWQVQFMKDFARDDHTKESPFQAVVQACNSSGKDKYIIAACAVWLCMRYKEVECPITSSSGNQLDNQTGAHIDRLCHKANAVFGKLWKINYRYYEFQHVGELGQPMPSKLKLFATDEAGKAEGYHPVDAGKKMAIFTSETKSIPEDITSALERCTGFTHRVDASSPGLPAGYFYNTCMSAIDRTSLTNVKSVDSTQVIRYLVTAYQCAHITHSEIERIASKLPGGKNNVVFRSSIMAEFGTTDEMVVIPATFVHRAVKAEKIVWLQEEHNTAGLDLSDGGAETVLAVRNGNKLIGLEAFRFEDSEDTISYLQEKFKFYNLNHRDALIFGDYCGMGGPMLKSLKRKGWSNMRYVDSRNTASETKTYANRGTELFFNMRLLLERNELILINDKTLTTQLSTRYYKITTKNIHQLLSKLEQKAKGYPSPDRADAVNLCFWNYKSTRVDSEIVLPFEKKEDDEEQNLKVVGDFDLNSWANNHRQAYRPDHIEMDNLTELQEELSSYNKQRKQLIGKN